jgi:hypothetical protein
MSVTAVQQQISMMEHELTHMSSVSRPVVLLHFLRVMDGLYSTWMLYYRSLQDTIGVCSAVKRDTLFEPGSAVYEQFMTHYQNSLSLSQEAHFVVSLLLTVRDELICLM